MTSMNHRNRLAQESSPYLRQHATNPVDWFPWCDEAFAKAVAEDKPIFLSVGYSSCHWCHVMAHESFEHPDVATILNRDFIPVKVDREEQPEVDALYMTATQLITQRGGWPNSVWLTPDGRPWYAGTYFPREDRQGRIGFTSLLLKLFSLWNERRDDVEKQADALTEAIRQQQEGDPSGDTALPGTLQLARKIQDHFINQFDPRYGGFGDAPKFPPHSALLLLMRTRKLSSSKETDTVIRATLDAMKHGGIYDQIGGGFHRYSTDEKWLLPHFEKMLYDNALLLKVYAIAAAAFNDPSYRRIVSETIEWLSREMSHIDGGFYSALDADSEGEEGRFYTWSSSEIESLTGAADFINFASLYQIRPHGNFDDEATGRSTGLNIPHLRTSSTEVDIQQMAGVRDMLRTHRGKRTRPGLDDKIIAGWNGLTISALAVAGKCLDMPAYIDMAVKARTFIDKHLCDGDRLKRCWCGHVSSHEGTLDDYAAIALADLDLFEATGNRMYLESATRRVAGIQERFYDATTGQLYMTSTDQPATLIRLKDVFDQGSPSGTGLTVQAMVRISRLNSDDTMMNLARGIALKHQSLIQRVTSAVTTLTEGLIMSDGSISENSNAPEVLVSFSPALPCLDQNGQLHGVLTIQLPEGWHLNPVFRGENDIPRPFEFRSNDHRFATCVSMESAGENTWRVVLPAGQWKNHGGTRLDFTVCYQPCTTTECLPIRQQSIRVKL